MGKFGAAPPLKPKSPIFAEDPIEARPVYRAVASESPNPAVMSGEATKGIKSPDDANDAGSASESFLNEEMEEAFEDVFRSASPSPPTTPQKEEKSVIEAEYAAAAASSKHPSSPERSDMGYRKVAQARVDALNKAKSLPSSPSISSRLKEMCRSEDEKEEASDQSTLLAEYESLVYSVQSERHKNEVSRLRLHELEAQLDSSNAIINKNLRTAADEVDALPAGA